MVLAGVLGGCGHVGEDATLRVHYKVKESIRCAQLECRGRNGREGGREGGKEGGREGGREGEMKGSVENRSFNGYNLPHLKGRIVHCLQRLKQFSVDIQTN